MAIVKQTLAMQAYNILVKEIISGKIIPGSRLTEEALSLELGISRTPVRDVLKRLEQEGLTERLGKGYCVKKLSEERCGELFRCRALIEVQSLLLGFALLPRETLKELYQDLRAAGAKDAAISYEVDSAIHRMIREYCPNSFLREILERLQCRCDALRYYRTAGAVSGLEQLRNERLALLEAMIDGPAEHAAALLKEHIERGADVMRCGVK